MHPRNPPRSLAPQPPATQNPAGNPEITPTTESETKISLGNVSTGGGIQTTHLDSPPLPTPPAGEGEGGGQEGKGGREEEEEGKRGGERRRRRARGGGREEEGKRRGKGRREEEEGKRGRGGRGSLGTTLKYLHGKKFLFYIH